MYWGSTGELVYKQEFRPLKRLSCPGCEECAWIDDYLLEDVGCGVFPQNSNLKNNDICKIKVSKEYTDWETGLVDEIELEFIEVKDE